MASRRAKVNKFDYKKLSSSDVICPICRSILIKPITLPCTHGFCSSCLNTTQNANVCPLCRVRVGSWLRSATKSKKLINETLWQAIQDLFPLQVKNKLNVTHEDSVKKINDKNDIPVKDSQTVSNLNKEELQKNKPNIATRVQNNKIDASVASGSTNSLVKIASLVNTVQNNQAVLVNAEKNDKRPNFLTSFATKEYTCRILCQNVSSKDTPKNIHKESQVFIKKRNKRMQEITESEGSNERSNSIESECLYFKPIDYRHNPPSEGLAPIKVPTRKPNINSNFKILAPSGQNKINMNYLESAFARLCSAVSEVKVDAHKKENIESKIVQQNNSAIPVKRKHEKSENKAKKKAKSSQKLENQSLKSKQGREDTLPITTEIDQCKNSATTQDITLLISNPNYVKKIGKCNTSINCLLSEEDIKRSLQEQADFELAMKLQQTYDQSSKYVTRSMVLKTMAENNPVKMEGIMTPYKVK